MDKKVLGRGLSSLLGVKRDEILLCDISKIKPSPFQPRRNFDEKTLLELKQSIEQKGIIEPIIVRRKNGEFELVCGERRLRAAKLAGLTKIPAIIKDLTDEEAFEIALIENIQREDLNPIEYAIAFKKLSEMGYTHEEIAKKIGKSRSYVTNTLRILELPNKIKELIEKGKITLGHAKVLVGLDEKEIEKIEIQNTTVRELEEKVREIKKEKKGKNNTNKLGSELEKIKKFFEKFGDTKVYETKGKVKIVINFKVEEINNVIEKCEKFL